VQRVRWRDFGQAAGFPRAAHGAQQVERFRQGELLSQEGLREAPAANLAAGFHAA
jgi:hypothetical protein